MLESFADQIRARQRVRYVLNQPGSFDSTSLKDSEDFILSTSPREDDLKEDSARHLWKLIFNTAVESIDRPDSD